MVLILKQAKPECNPRVPYCALVGVLYSYVAMKIVAYIILSLMCNNKIISTRFSALISIQIFATCVFHTLSLASVNSLAQFQLRAPRLARHSATYFMAFVSSYLLDAFIRSFISGVGWRKIRNAKIVKRKTWNEKRGT